MKKAYGLPKPAACRSPALALSGMRRESWEGLFDPERGVADETEKGASALPRAACVVTYRRTGTFPVSGNSLAGRSRRTGRLSFGTGSVFVSVSCAQRFSCALRSVVPAGPYPGKTNTSAVPAAGLLCPCYLNGDDRRLSCRGARRRITAAHRRRHGRRGRTPDAFLRQRGSRLRTQRGRSAFSSQRAVRRDPPCLQPDSQSPARPSPARPWIRAPPTPDSFASRTNRCRRSPCRLRFRCLPFPCRHVLLRGTFFRRTCLSFASAPSGDVFLLSFRRT